MNIQKKIKSTDVIVNEQVIRRVDENISMLDAVMKSKANWFDHAMRTGLILDVIKVKLEGISELGNAITLDDLKMTRS